MAKKKLKIKIKKAHQVDNLDRYALTTLTVSRSWSFSPQLQYLQRRYSVQVLENVPVETIILAMAINKPIDQVGIVSSSSCCCCCTVAKAPTHQTSPQLLVEQKKDLNVVE